MENTPATPLVLGQIEQAEQTAYWIYDNLLTVLLRLERGNTTDVPVLLAKVKTLYAHLGHVLEQTML